MRREQSTMSRGQSIRVARSLRRAETETEQRLWEALRSRRLAGLKWRRQHPLFGYVVDFYCSRYSLVVELDGAPHEEPEQAAYDRFREADLRSHGLTVIRFKSDEVVHHLDDVLERVAAAVGRPAK